MFKYKKVCIVIAHPDDESMFFGPLITSIDNNNSSTNINSNTSTDSNTNSNLNDKYINSQLYILCLSTGI